MLPNDNFYYWTYKGIHGRWTYCGKPTDYWLKSAKQLCSPSHFIIASFLLAMEVWDIIGIEEVA
jgi:hypothetical protein